MPFTLRQTSACLVLLCFLCSSLFVISTLLMHIHLSFLFLLKWRLAFSSFNLPRQSDLGSSLVPPHLLQTTRDEHIAMSLIWRVCLFHQTVSSVRTEQCHLLICTLVFTIESKVLTDSPRVFLKFPWWILMQGVSGPRQPTLVVGATCDSWRAFLLCATYSSSALLVAPQDDVCRRGST